jgi:transposase
MKRIRKHLVHLTASERSTLQAFVSSGQKKAREITRARILLLTDAGHTDAEIVTALGCCRPMVWAMRKRYAEGHFDHIVEVLHEAPRGGRPIRIDSRVEAQITMIACADPPPGAARWTLHLIADQLVKLEMVESISHERVRQALKKTA